ncbi:appendage [Achromobacter phage vB_AxyP_19-32_Axy12]|uniref:Putative tail fiber protein n=1 Tax=Achromobacter phage vB_AxyP_19-32_Axy12 TaxID=2591043 RepID=A0A514CUC4_9CAUD|nr:appendage [Achromobacter phage vB_AxyP_19-32_Axy12]QDH84085.1 putative tail fiber protein [Achromobacter phage vB_AxyP_19-32_Axy12]
MNSQNPFPSGDSCCGTNYDMTVDQLLGNAYQVVKFVAMRMPFIKTVSDNIQSVIDIATNLGKLLELQDKLPELLALQGQLQKLIALFDQLQELVALADNLPQLLTVYDNLDNIQAIVDNMNQIHTVSAEIAKIVSVANNISAVVNVSANLAAILNVETNLPAVDNVSTNITDVRNVSTNMSAVVGVNSNMATVLSVAEFIPELTNINNELVNALEYIEALSGPSGSTQLGHTNSDGSEVTVSTALNDLGANKLSKVAVFGSKTVDVLYRNGVIYESKGTVTKQETRVWMHDFRPTIEDGAAFNTDGGNIFLGHGAGGVSLTALPDADVPPGKDANLQASHNIGIGVQALGSVTIGYKNVAVGNNALRKNTEGHGNSAFGRDAGHENTTGNENTFLGFTAGQLSATGHYNTYSGTSSGYNNTAGQGNTAHGRRALFGMTSGDYNTGIGENAGFGHLSGSYNLYLGKQAANAGITTGSNATVIGSRISGLPNISGVVAIGDGAGKLYVSIFPTGGSPSRMLVESTSATAYDASSVNGQSDQGTSLVLVNNANSATAFSQIAATSRVGGTYGRLVFSGGVNPFIALVSNNQELVRFTPTGGLRFGGATGVAILTGAGSPEGVVTAPPGSMYLNTSGGSGATLWIKEANNTATGWVAK